MRPHAVQLTEVRDRDETDVFRWLGGPTTVQFPRFPRDFPATVICGSHPSIPTRYPHNCLLDNERLLLRKGQTNKVLRDRGFVRVYLMQFCSKVACVVTTNTKSLWKYQTTDTNTTESDIEGMNTTRRNDTRERIRERDRTWMRDEKR